MPASPTAPLLTITRDGDHATARFAPRTSLTDANLDEVNRALLALVEGADRPSLVLDLAGVEYLNSMALATFVGLSRKARAAGGRLTLTNLTPLVRKVFAVTRLDAVLTIEDALALPAA